MTVTTTPSVPTDPGPDPVEPADDLGPVTTGTDKRPVTRLGYAWRVLLVSFLGFVIAGWLRRRAHAPYGTAWLLLAALCLVGVLAVSTLRVVQTRRARRRRRSRRETRPRERHGSGYGRRVPVSSVIAVTVAVLIVIAFDYGLANLPPPSLK